METRGGCAPLLLAALVVVAALPSPAQEPAPPSPPEAGAEEPVALPLPEVTARAEEAARKLREIEKRLEPSPAVQRIERELPALAAALEERRAAAIEVLEATPSLEFLADLENAWRASDVLLSSWANDLRARAEGLEQELAATKEMRAVWKATREAAREQAAPQALEERIAATREAITATRKRLAARRDEVLVLQGLVGEQQTSVAATLADIASAREAAVEELFAFGEEPVWSAVFRRRLSANLAEGLGGAAAAQQSALWSWMRGRAPRFAFHAVAFAALLALLLAARRRLQGAEPEIGGLEPARPILARPVATALLLAILLGPWLYPQAPRAAVQIQLAAALIPAVVLLRALVARALHPLLYALIGFLVVDRARQVLEPLPALARAVFVVEMLAALGLLLWLMRPSRLARIPPEASRSRLLRRAGAAARLALAGLVAAVVLESIGFARLGRLLGGAILGSSYAAVILYAAVRITSALWHFALQVAPLRGLGMVKRNRSLLERRGNRALRLAGYAAWIVVSLRLLALADPLLAGARKLLGAELAFGALKLSLGNLLAFVVTVWAAFLASRLLRFVLEEDVFPRTRLQRGMPYAISTLLHYAVLLLGFLLAVAATGIDLDRFAILAGAFGVGIGFGLQNIVNNFVSGLILLFERPIQIGDRIQVGQLWGEVRRIGIRSSIVRSFEGAEVIVPNGNLLSSEVTNWTLSDRHRRVEVKVGVAYGTNATRVLEILRATAQSHPDVLSAPAPLILFDGFGESSLDFRMLVWLRDFDRGLAARSELSVAVQAALAEAGIEVPFPQRDLHVRSADPEIQALFVPGDRSHGDEPSQRES